MTADELASAIADSTCPVRDRRYWATDVRAHIKQYRTEQWRKVLLAVVKATEHLKNGCTVRYDLASLANDPKALAKLMEDSDAS